MNRGFQKLRSSTNNNRKMYFMVFFLGCLHFASAVTLETVMVDMSHTYDESVKNYLTWESFNSTITTNDSTTFGFWVMMEDIRTSTHMGTHIDAPSHFVLGGLDVDQIPLTSLVAPAAVIDIFERASRDIDAMVTVEDLQAWERKTGQTLNGTIVLMYSGWGAKWGNLSDYTGTTERDYSKFRCPGFSPEASQWLVDNRDIKGVGSDSLNYDRCSDRNFSTHKIIHGAGLYGLESVANVDKIPIYGATLYVLPMKIGRGSGAPTRIIATFPKVIF